ncbi:hypothetical protein DL769_002158 [Monosporascus sp. CRB-8-3]|nr:hypothetical protein DL769_002158 [Monosporascus sp. CRB-8-3]
MERHKFILTNSPYTTKQIALASFIPNVKYPHQDAQKPYSLRDSDWSSQADDAIDLLVSRGSATGISALATRFARIFFKNETGDAWRLQAQKGYIYSLENPADLFRDIVFGKGAGEHMQRWLEDCKLQGVTPRFVVAYRTYIDARLFTSRQRSTIEAGGVVVPGIVLGDVSGMADIGAEASHRSDDQTRGEMTLPGERVYAICYRKIRIRYREGKTAATLVNKNVWEPFDAPRGAAEGPVYIEADLAADDDDGHGEPFLLREEEERAGIVGVLPEENSDSDDGVDDEEAWESENDVRGEGGT